MDGFQTTDLSFPRQLLYPKAMGIAQTGDLSVAM